MTLREWIQTETDNAMSAISLFVWLIDKKNKSPRVASIIAQRKYKAPLELRSALVKIHREWKKDDYERTNPKLPFDNVV